jgi:hypothetical protein
MSYFDDASLVFIPSGTKVSKAYSVKPIDGTGDLTFTRSNDTATRVASNGLIEKVRTNLALYSEQFDNAYWAKSQATITANATTAPDGTLTAEKFIEGSGSVAPECSRTPIAPSNSIFTLSVFAKASERNFLIINNNDGTGSFRVWFNLTTGVIGTTDAGVTAFIENVGNGWFRCGVARQITAFASATSAFQIGSADGVDTYTGDGTSGIFIWGAQMELSDFGPTDYIATTSAAVSVGPVANVPRLDYLGSSCPRLLLEPQRTNLVTYSEQFNNAAYDTSEDVTIAANVATSPAGFLDADNVIPDATSNFHRVKRTLSVTAAPHTFSVYVKPNGYNFFLIRTSDLNNNNVGYDLINGTVTFTASGYTGFISEVGNGWYRLGYVRTYDATTVQIGFRPQPTAQANNAIATFTGDGTSGALVWGAQLEAGAYATSYIPTLGSASTRGSDAASKTGISSLIGQTQGTVFVEFEITTNDSFSSGFPALIDISDATINNRFSLFLNDSSFSPARLQLFVSNGGVTQVSITASAPISVGRHKVAFGYALNNYAIYMDGALIGTNTSGTVPACSKLAFTNFDGSIVAENKTNQALLFKTRLSNDSLAALTA